MPKAWVTVTAYNAENYSRRIASMSEVQIHSSDGRVKEPSMSEVELLGKVGVVIDPKQFPEMDRFLVSVELVKQ